MKSLTDLLIIMLTEVGMKCGTTTTRDIKYCLERIKQEGESFITLTLPSFSDDFDRSLEEGRIDPTAFRAFRKVGRIPALLQGISSRVFDKTSGLILDEPDVGAILCIRQVCRFAKKILLPCTKEKENASISNYIQIERELTATEGAIDPLLYSEFMAFAARGLSLCFRELLHLDGYDRQDERRSRRERLFDLCRHGPGAVREGYSSNERYQWKSWPARLDLRFPFTRCAYASELMGSEIAESIEFQPEVDEQPVKVTLVPKTLKGPRVIAIEPAAMQYTQQALMRYLVSTIESQRSFMKGHVNFSDQSINGRLALEASKDRKLATLDLKDASDRVLSSLVYDMFAVYPDFRDMLFACRSTRAELPNGTILPLKKFASMGSAVCFPIESIVFFLITLFAIARERPGSLHQQDFNNLASEVYVYGDDIVCPADKVPSVVSILEAFGLKVNRNKSFSKGNFRESCGVDAYAGTDITPVYLRRPLPDNSQSSRELVSLVSFSNQLYKKGWYMSALACEEYVQSVRRFPYVGEQAPCVGFVRGYLAGRQRWNKELQRIEIYASVIVPRTEPDPIEGYGAVTKWYHASDTTGPLRVKTRLDYEKSVGRGRLTLKSRWSSAV